MVFTPLSAERLVSGVDLMLRPPGMDVSPDKAVMSVSTPPDLEAPAEFRQRIKATERCEAVGLLDNQIARDARNGGQPCQRHQLVIPSRFEHAVTLVTAGSPSMSAG